jgi:hypothetical protein
MTKPASPLYTIRHPEADRTIAERIHRGCSRSVSRPLVFFRADDIGIPSLRFTQLIACFQKHSLPLCLATVPAWLTGQRLAELRQTTGTTTSLWCWHQHGQVHHNFENEGKKQEFGPARPPAIIRSSLAQGRRRLEQLLAEDFLPVFTPPWNRCGEATLQALADLGYVAVSRSLGARPPTLPGLPDFQVNVDLHTRKESDPRQSFAKLLAEIEEGFASGRCGIMIHHQRMNGHALELLDLFLEKIAGNQQVQPVHFGDLVKNLS